METIELMTITKFLCAINLLISCVLLWNSIRKVRRAKAMLIEASTLLDITKMIASTENPTEN